MLRLTRCMKNGMLLYLKRAEFQLASVSHTAPNFKYKKVGEREPCPVPLPPKPKPKDDTLIWGAIFVATLTGAFVFYAKNSPEVRDWLTIYAPWIDDFIAVIYQENITYEEAIEKCIKNLKSYFSDTCDEDKKPSSVDISPIKAIPTVPEKPKELTQDVHEVTTSEDEIKKEVEAPVINLPPPLCIRDICDVEACLIGIHDCAVYNYTKAKDTCANYNKLVEETMLNFSVTKLKELRNAMEERSEVVKSSLQKATDVQAGLGELNRYLECGGSNSAESIDKAKNLMNLCKDKIKSAFVEFQWENDKSLVRDSQWQLVESTIDKYTEENEVMLPGLHYSQNKFQLTADPDLLLYHAYRYTRQLQDELNEAVAGMRDRVDRGLNNALPQGEKEVQARKALLQKSIKQKRAEMERDYKNRSEAQKNKNKQDLANALHKQLERHQEMLEAKLQEREREGAQKIKKMVVERVAAEKRVFANQLSEMSYKLKIVEDKLNSHLKAEKEARRSQELWTAGASLLAATKKGDNIVNVKKELTAIKKASGEDDKLVTTVIKAIPKSAWDVGIVPESVLKKKYYQMEKTAMKVALVETDGSPLPIYFLSWLQSFFLLFKVSGIPQAEVDKPPKEPCKDLDTFDLLQRARFWIERSNLTMAIRYVNALEGASRIAADTWLQSAQTHLVIKQAAEAVIAHAAALGLKYI